RECQEQQIASDRQSRAVMRQENYPTILYSNRGFEFQMSLVRWGRAKLALDLSADTLAFSERRKWEDSVAGAYVVQAECHRILKAAVKSQALLGRARTWALRTSDHEILLWCSLIEARVRRDLGHIALAIEAVRSGIRMAQTSGFA